MKSSRQCATAALAAALLAVSLIWTACLSQGYALGSDAGYFLMNAHRVAQGDVPYRDFYYLYTPAFLYLQNLYQAVLGANSESLLWEIWTHHAAVCGLLLYSLRAHFGASCSTCAIAAGAFFPLMATLQGFGFYLEMEINLWGWVAITLALSAGRRLKSQVSRPPMAVFALAAAGAAAGGLSAWTKQVGAVFALLALALPHLMAGRLVRSLLLPSIAAAAVPGLVFFACFPGALVSFFQIAVGDLFTYAAASKQFTTSLAHVPFMIKHWFWVPGVLGLTLLDAAARSWDRADSDGLALDRVTAALSAAGLALYVPFLARGYPHYLQLVFPLLVASAVPVWSRALRRRGPLLAHLAIPALALFTTLAADLRDFQRTMLSLPTPREAERRMAAWIEEQVPGHREVLILPASLQLYFLCGRVSATGRYSFFPPEDDVRAAAAKGAPVFVALRGTDRVEHYETALVQSGYSRVTSLEEKLFLWLPREGARQAAPAASQGTVP